MSALLDSFDWNSLERLLVLSPHLDDAALSCGGLLTALATRVSCQVVTVCAGDPEAGGDGRRAGRKGFAAPRLRRAEDRAAMESIGAGYVHLGFADAIYRRDEDGALIYSHGDDFLGEVASADAEHVETVGQVLWRVVCFLGKTLVLAPMAIGRHVDHRICARVALNLARSGVHVLFYEDVPYVFPDCHISAPDDVDSAAARLGARLGERLTLPVDVDAKTELLAHYQSQVPMLFKTEEEMRASFLRYTDELGAPIEGYWSLEA